MKRSNNNLSLCASAEIESMISQLRAGDASEQPQALAASLAQQAAGEAPVKIIDIQTRHKQRHR